MRIRALILTGLILPFLTACGTMAPYSVEPRTYSSVRSYQVFCASCHGLTGHGDGPVQPILAIGVPDLTRISQRNGGRFPTDKIREIIDGRTEYAAHGTRQMPVWGSEFYGTSPNEQAARREADITIDRLVKYLQTLQPDYYK